MCQMYKFATAVSIFLRCYDCKCQVLLAPLQVHQTATCYVTAHTGTDSKITADDTYALQRTPVK